MADFEAKRNALLKLKERKTRKVELLREMQNLPRDSAKFLAIQSEALAIDRETAIIMQQLGRASAQPSSVASTAGTTYQALPSTAGRAAAPPGPMRAPLRSYGSVSGVLAVGPGASVHGPRPNGAELAGQVAALKREIAEASAQENFEQCLVLREKLRQLDPAALSSPPPMRRKRSMSAGSLPVPNASVAGTGGPLRAPPGRRPAGPPPTRMATGGSARLAISATSDGGGGGNSGVSAGSSATLPRSVSARRPVDIKLSAEQLRAKVVAEIVETEASYVRDLEYVVETYVVGLSSNAGDLFANWTDLLTLNSALLKRLKAPDCSIGQIFVETADYLKIYRDYVKNQRAAASLLVKLREKDSDVRKFLEAAKQRPGSKGLSLDAYLVKPLQRITKYPLLLRELLKYTPASHNDHQSIVQAMERMQAIVTLVNDAIEHVAAGPLLKQLSELPGAEDLDVVIPSRRIQVKHLCFWRNVTDGDKKGKPARVYLFNDALLVAKVKSGKDCRVRCFVTFEDALLRPSLDTIFYDASAEAAALDEPASTGKQDRPELELVSVSDRLTSALSFDDPGVLAAFRRDCSSRVSAYWRGVYDQEQLTSRKESVEPFDAWMAAQRTRMLGQLAQRPPAALSSSSSKRSGIASARTSRAGGTGTDSESASPARPDSSTMAAMPPTSLTPASPRRGVLSSSSGSTLKRSGGGADASSSATPLFHGSDRNHTTGWLKKKGKARWFLLDNDEGKLYWFKSQPNCDISFISRKSSQNSCQLAQYGVMEAVDCEIRLPLAEGLGSSSSANKAYMLLAQTPDDAELWAQSLRRSRLAAIDALKKQEQQKAAAAVPTPASPPTASRAGSRRAPRPFSAPLSSEARSESAASVPAAKGSAIGAGPPPAAASAATSPPQKRKLFGLIRSPRGAAPAAKEPAAVEADVLPTHCQNCGTATVGEKKFCVGCGSQCPLIVRLAPVSSNPARCSSCHTLAVFGGSYCGSCANRL